MSIDVEQAMQEKNCLFRAVTTESWRINHMSCSNLSELCMCLLEKIEKPQANVMLNLVTPVHILC